MFSYASGRVACVNYDFGRVAGIKKVSQMVPSFCRVIKHVGSSWANVCTVQVPRQTLFDICACRGRTFDLLCNASCLDFFGS